MTTTDVGARTFVATAAGRDLVTSDRFDVINPATGQVLATAPWVLPGQLDEVFAAAAAAGPGWARDEDRRRVAMREAAAVVEARVDELAVILTSEQGKPLNDAKGELGRAVSWLRYYADLEIPREIVRDDDQAFQEVVRRPMGVVAAITPWNVPIGLAMWKIAPALRAGNTIVVKPSPYTPLTTLAVGHLLREVLPPGVLNVVSGPEPLGAALVSHPVPRKVSFTGSTAVGRLVSRAAAEDLKRITLELGGNDPAIILPDVDVNAVAPALFWGSFMNNGQVCLAAKRIYAHRDIYADLADAVAEIAVSVRVGNGLDEGTRLGPINNKPQFERVEMLVEDAMRNGAAARAGGRALDRAGYFFAPTILTGVRDGVKVVDEEQFGPVMPIIAFDHEDDVVERANASEYGLTASVWSADIERAYLIADRLDTGQVSINVHGGGVLPTLPFGGHKASGVGVENGPWGLHGFTELQVISGPPRPRA
ncbi:aldehyde dehydrogenase family protein [Acrocarpospora macrocephala]|uniref:Aldehyde dehydrogenase n=1 Tax=Acrocarpospora macrocephala TaxID=150177 RepID=A0A5M3WQV4_9ACTN|nr:aldehyde dehydrogenase family protein [Acrocarpospora macrocephala]GES11284.1 aldehyde dehydrogenase [Acrocarpospora macrocephala]